MLRGTTLPQLATELERQENAKADYVASTKTMVIDSTFAELVDRPLTPRQSFIRLDGIDAMPFPINDSMHNQIAGRLKIPTRHYDRLRTDHPDILHDTVNKLFQREPARRMVRTLDGSARAFLSNRYLQPYRAGKGAEVPVGRRSSSLSRVDGWM